MSDLVSRVAMLERMVMALSRRLGAPIGFSRSTAPPIDTGAVQTIQGQMDALSNRDAMPVLFHYGYSSAMPVGGDKVVAYLDATRSSPVVVATGHQAYRYTGLILGETVLYDMWGRYLLMGSSGPVMQCNGVPMTIQGDLHVTGAVVAGFGGGDQVGVQTHIHAVPEHAGNSSAPTAGT